MTEAAAPRSPLAGTTALPVRLALLAAWLVLVIWLAAHHVFWRDEVRAFSLALAGDGPVGMARAVHGEGHPLLWYLALRLAHTIAPVREVLPVMAFAFAAGAAALLAWRAPFRPVVLTAILFGGWMAHEYGVMARNYGIAALLCFVLADRMARGSRNGWTIGALLALLANTNVPAVILAGGFLVFWLVELVAESGWRQTRAWRDWVVAAAVAALGVVACFLTVYPPVHDAAVIPSGDRSATHLLALALQAPVALKTLMPEWLQSIPGAMPLFALLLLISPFSLARSPGGLVAAIVVLPALGLFFQLVYPGSYRHAALYLAFLVALHWMVAAGRGGAWFEPWRHGDSIARAGGTALLALLALQVAALAPVVAGVANGYVGSRARDLGTLLARADLQRAVVIADPDAMIEALPYYAPNPTWLVRERRFGGVSRFTRAATNDLHLADVIAAARAIQRRTGRPVVIVTAPRLDPAQPATVWQEGYGQTMSTTPAEVRAFLAATTRLARFAPATSDESYDVYLLKAPLTAS